VTAPAPAPRADPAATRARLHRIIAEIEGRPPEAARPPVDRLPPSNVAPSRDLLAAATRRDTNEGACTYREVRYPLAHEAGHQPLADILGLSPATLELLAPNEGLDDATLADLYFLDIETTGLGGAGAIAFLVATARYDPSNGDPAFVVRQYLAESPPEEAAVLDALIADGRFAEEPVLVTYNGRAFDSPLLDERATMHRRRAGFEALRQLDLLHPARTAYRGLLPNCRLATMEHHLLGMTRPSEDIPGAEVPHWYFRFLRTGDQRMLNPIVEHNELDVVGLVGLLAWSAAHLDAAREPSPRDALGLGRLLAARGDDARARPHLVRAAADPAGPDALDDGPALEASPTSLEAAPPPLVDPRAWALRARSTRRPRLDRSPASGGGDDWIREPFEDAPADLDGGLPAPAAARRSPEAIRAYSGQTAYRPDEPRRHAGLEVTERPTLREEALIRLAALHKRNEERDLAAGCWRRALALPARAPLQPLIELAMYYEHQRHDFAGAIACALDARLYIETHLRPYDRARADRWLDAIDHRLTRLHSRAERAS
jgi:hypothetical protein